MNTNIWNIINSNNPNFYFIQTFNHQKIPCFFKLLSDTTFIIEIRNDETIETNIKGLLTASFLESLFLEFGKEFLNYLTYENLLEYIDFYQIIIPEEILIDLKYFRPFSICQYSLLSVLYFKTYVLPEISLKDSFSKKANCIAFSSLKTFQENNINILYFSFDNGYCVKDYCGWGVFENGNLEPSYYVWNLENLNFDNFDKIVIHYEKNKEKKGINMEFLFKENYEIIFKNDLEKEKKLKNFYSNISKNF